VHKSGVKRQSSSSSSSFDETFNGELKVELKGTFVLLGLDESNYTIDDKANVK